MEETTKEMTTQDIGNLRSKFQEKWVIVKYGGNIAGKQDTIYRIGLQCAFLQANIGAKVVIIHGGGEQTSQALMAQGISPTFDAKTGRRVTDLQTLRVFDATLRELNEINVKIMRKTSDKIMFLGAAGYDHGGIISAESMGDFTGRVTSIHHEFFGQNAAANNIPVIYTACQNMSQLTNERRLNVNADEVAGAIGRSLKAACLLMLTDTDGVWGEDKTVLPMISTDEVKAMVNNGIVKGGMITKLNVAAQCAQEMPSGHVIILNGHKEWSILTALLERGHSGTKVYMPPLQFRL